MKGRDYNLDARFIMTLPSGTRIGVYEVLAPLGAGGMGEVYRARDTRLDRDVALKILPDAFAADSDRVARFEREAKTLAALNHPHIAQIHGFEQSGSTSALVMELVDGEDLAERIERGPIPIDEAMLIALQIADALEAAHEQSIIHRDLKPANVKLRPDGTAKVLDFGLAKAFDPAAAQAQSAALSPTITSPMTMHGVILGTAAYMSPEQAKGRAVDRRADIWAFGCVLYEMLTGRQAFDGEDVSEVLGSILKTEPDWTRLPAGTPIGIRTLLRRCLTKDAKQRVQHMGDARIEIAAAARADGTEAATLRASSSRLAWGAAAFFAVVAMGAVAPMLRETPAPSETRFEVTTPPTGQLTLFQIAPHGRSIVFSAFKDGHSMLWLRSLGAVEARPLAGTENAQNVFWSPDSRSIAFVAGGELKRLDIAGGVPQVIAPAPVFRGGSWNGKGFIMFVPNPSIGLFTVPAKGGEAQPLTALGNTSGRFGPLFLPDDSHFIYVEEPGIRGLVSIGSLDDARTTQLLEGTNQFAFLPSGFLLFVRQGALFAQRLDLRARAMAGEPVEVIRPADGSAVLSVSAAADTGAFVYRLARTGGRERLSWRDRSGKRLEPYFDFDGQNVALSPDGRRAVMVRNSDLWLVDLPRALPTRFTSANGTESWPAWSPDSAKVAFRSRTGMQVKALAAAESTMLHAQGGEFQAFPTDWSRDAKYLLYGAVSTTTSHDLWALPLTGESKPFPVVQSRFDETRGQFSPDGRWVSYESNESGRNEVYARPFNRAGVPIQISIGGGSEARWNVNGRELFYIGAGARMMAVDVRASADGNSLEVGAARELFLTQIAGGGVRPPTVAGNSAVSSDGTRFLINESLEGDQPNPLIVVLNWKPPGGR